MNVPAHSDCSSSVTSNALPATTEASAGRTTPVVARRRYLRRLALVPVALAVAAAAVAGCTASPESAVGAPPRRGVEPSASASPVGKHPRPKPTLPSRTGLGAGQYDWMTFKYTGHVETLTVPAHVSSAEVYLAGAPGSNPTSSLLNAGDQGYGVTLNGVLSVKPGDTLTIAVGGAGEAANGNNNPGAGGWSLPGFKGGDGGSGHGAATFDGGGGGGASVIQRNGETVAVAAGAGGAGGPNTHAASFLKGGSGGVYQGFSGHYSIVGDGPENAGPGATADSNYEKKGGSYSGSALKGGGGGGGGGWRPGGGGVASIGGGGGGGGGMSQTSHLADLDTWEGATCGFTSCSAAGFSSAQVALVWQTTPDVRQDYVFQLTDAPNKQLLEVHGAGTEPKDVVDTWHRVLTDAGKVQDNQQWTYVFDGSTGQGQLVNKNSGLCLEVNGTDGQIDQWTCTDEAVNQQWQLVERKDGETALAVTLGDHFPEWAPGTYYLGTGSDPGTSGDGTKLTLLKQVDDNRTAWTATKVS